MLVWLKNLFGIPSTRQYVPVKPRKMVQPATGMDWGALAKPDAQVVSRKVPE